jgi:hypothetical protein
MRPPFRSVAWACGSEALAPPISPCALTVEFVRSCFTGYWRFFAGSPGLITPGWYWFNPPGTPCLNDFHFFGSEDWRHGDDEEVVGVVPPPQMGNDKSLGWEWYDGKGPDQLPPPGSVGAPSDFQQPQIFTPGLNRPLVNGIDQRCYVPTPPCFTPNLLLFATNNCAFMLVCAGMVKKVQVLDKVPLEQFLRTFLGSAIQIDWDDGDAVTPPTVIVQTARNNLVVLGGTANNNQLLLQIRAAVTGPTQYGNISTLTYWWNRATRIIDQMNTVGVDYSKPTFLVGYSYGAATACVMWWRLYDANRTRIIRLVTMGCPKPGDSRLLSQMNLFAFGTHVVNSSDIVPRVPPPVAFQGILTVLFPFLPGNWYADWTPHAEYLQILAGGVFDTGPLVGATLAEYIGFVAGTLVRGDLNPVNNHYIDAYIRGLSLHCPDPEAPFDADCYELLFGVRSFGPGGVVFDGEGIIPPLGTPAGLVLDGAGIIPPLGTPAGLVLDGAGIIPPLGTPAELVVDGAGDVGLFEPTGLVLDGAGIIPPLGTPAGLVLDGAGIVGMFGTPAGLVLDGAGVLTLPPGPTCATAALMTLGTVYSGNTSTTVARWYLIPLTSGTLYHIRMTFGSPSIGVTLNHGASCAGLTLVSPPPSSLTPCVTYTPGSSDFLYVTVGADLGGPNSYTVVVDTGPC